MGKELFDNIPSKVANILSDVKNGRVGLPDLQRPFVWQDNKVRELLDSMMKGYPIGYIMLWASPDDYENTVHIGKNEKIYKRPNDLVIDGQQRLTALLAAMYGVTIMDKNYKERAIRISFNPLTREFAVWTPAFEKNPEWISEISQVFAADEEHNISKFRKAYIKIVNEGRAKNNEEELTEDEEDRIEENINDLLNLGIYSLPTLKINSKANEENVADIFVRVNSGGQNLTEKNFIETLIAVYDNAVHDKINQFCADSRIPANGTSFNQILQVDPSHLIRMSVGVGFRRARLRYVYMLLRGKNLKTGEITQNIREENLKIFKESLDMVTNLNNWHAFMNLFASAGYLKGSFVASSNAVVFSYVLYLIGKYDYKVSSVELQKIISKWIFMSTITGFYTGSTESQVEKQFADLRDVHNADEFVVYLDSVIANRFTDDYFEYSLPSELNSSSATSPAWYGYIAAINVLGTPMLFSTAPLSQYFILGTSGDKNSIDKHHIFPKNYLGKIGYNNDRDRNQIANFTYLDYATNIDISDAPPTEYVSRYRDKLGEEGYKLACKQNALPENFEQLSYPEFLIKRRILMAQIVKKAYDKLNK
ncbi:GmrSD restriction endonuclease domain-containing protein [Catenibacterium sp.]|uniref:GmrSD restriction endonuclease domain-containing protein n=1 Tax=Catenibacterium sp. TaxID=2049022 RepID=UPI003AEF4D9C